VPKVTFLPMNQTVETLPGRTILETALDHDIPVQHACGGFCACSTCHVIVKSGEANLSEKEESEEERLDTTPSVTLHSRLACQARVNGDIVVEIVNLEEH